MVWLYVSLVSMVISIPIAFYFKRDIFGTGGFTILGWIWHLICANVAGFGLSFIVIFFWACFAETEYVQYYEREITAINDNSSISGRFYLSGGRIDEKMVYVYFIKSNGGEKMDQVGADITTIYTSNNPRIVGYKEVFKNKFLRSRNFLEIGNYKYSIYVPKGTIKNEFNVDLE